MKYYRNTKLKDGLSESKLAATDYWEIIDFDRYANRKAPLSDSL